jgi:TolA-binding protein
MRLRVSARLLPLLLLAALLVPTAARAQVETREGIYLQNQIQELKRDLQTLRDQLSRTTPGGSSTLGGARAPAAPADGDVTASLLDRVSRLEDSMRALTGRLDELANAQQRMNDDLTKQIEDLNFKLGNGAAAPAAPASPGAPLPAAKPGALPPIPAATAPAAAAKRTPEIALQEGNAALARRDYPTAEAAAREVIAVPKSPRAYDGQFLLAQALVGKKDYQGAAIAYDDTYNHAKTGAHAPDALLGLANALTAIGEKRAACATLDKLHTEFPNLRPDLKDSNAAARQRAGCH